jgi:tetratricopeptide (TPR) repeat protein
MSKEELVQGLRKNWYLIAALVVIAAFAVVKLLTSPGGDTSPPPDVTANENQAVPSTQESLEALQKVTQPDEQAKARTQIQEYQRKIDANPQGEETPAYLMAMGNLYLQKLGDYEKAKTPYEHIILEFPDSEERRQAFLQLEACYRTQKDRTGLKWLYEKMLEAFPEDSQEYQYAQKQLENL